MTRIRIAGLLLCAGLLIRVTNRAAEPPKNPAHAPVELRAIEGQPMTDTVDLRNGNLHLKIPIRVTRQKTAVPLSRH